MSFTKSFQSTFQFLKAWVNPGIRREFEEESYELQLICLRITCLTLAFFVLSFAFIDYLIIPDQATQFLKIRLACSSFIAFIFLITLFFPDFIRRNTPFFYFATLLGTTGFLSWMVMQTGGHRSIYYAAINLVILIQAGLMPTNMGYVLFNSFAIYMTYLLPILWKGDIISPAHLVNNSAFMLMTTILTFISNTFLYFLRFQEFYGRKSLHGLNKQLHELAMKDGLTGLWNNRFLKHQLEVAIKFSKRYGSPFSLLMIDLDHFKAFNDTFGHLVGDRILQDIAKLTLSQIRGIDYAIRYGGDEFTAILTNADEYSARTTADRIFRSVASHPFYVGKEKVSLSVSIGWFTYRPEQGNFTSEEILKRADRALYEAKARRTA